MAQLDKTFPTMDCSICILAPKMIDVDRRQNIRLLTFSEVKEVRGEPGNFVVKVLTSVFNKSHEEANKIMLNVHKKGIGVCGIYTHEIAETKVYIVNQMATHNNFPLKCTMEKL